MTSQTEVIVILKPLLWQLSQSLIGAQTKHSDIFYQELFTTISRADKIWPKVTGKCSYDKCFDRLSSDLICVQTWVLDLIDFMQRPD